jgi:hypothetical protein
VSTFGSNPGSWSGAAWLGVNNPVYQIGETFSSFPGGQITDISCYVSGHSGNSFVGWLCVWNSSGSLLVATAQQTFSAGSGGIGGEAWHTVACTPTFVAAGTTIRIGWAKTGASYMEWSQGGSGSYNGGGNSSNPGSFSSSQNYSGNIGAYVTYNPGVAYVYRSGSFTAGQPYVERSGSESAGIPYVLRSGVWTPGG